MLGGWNNPQPDRGRRTWRNGPASMLDYAAAGAISVNGGPVVGRERSCRSAPGSGTENGCKVIGYRRHLVCARLDVGRGGKDVKLGP